MSTSSAARIRVWDSYILFTSFEEAVCFCSLYYPMEVRMPFERKSGKVFSPATKKGSRRKMDKVLDVVAQELPQRFERFALLIIDSRLL
jgi:hypothetical protein